MCRRDLPRASGSRPHRHPRAGIRGQQPGALVRGQLLQYEERRKKELGAGAEANRTASSTRSSPNRDRGRSRPIGVRPQSRRPPRQPGSAGRMALQEFDGQLATQLATEAGHLLLAAREKLFASGAVGTSRMPRHAGPGVPRQGQTRVLTTPCCRRRAARIRATSTVCGSSIRSMAHAEYSEPGLSALGSPTSPSGPSIGSRPPRSAFRRSTVRLEPMIRRRCHRSPRPPPDSSRCAQPGAVCGRTRRRGLRGGSTSTKAMSVVMGETDIYVHDGGSVRGIRPRQGSRLHPGFHVSRLDGSPIVYNQPRSLAPGLHRLSPRVGRVGPQGAVQAASSRRCTGNRGSGRPRSGCTGRIVTTPRSPPPSTGR